MTWTMLTIVVNLYGGQPVVLPGYEYTSEEACKAQLYEPKRLKPVNEEMSTTAAIVSSVCVPVNMNSGYVGEE